MNTRTSTAIFERIDELERELQRLKVRAYFNMPQKRRTATYALRAIRNAVKNTRDEIWRSRYASKIARFS